MNPWFSDLHWPQVGIYRVFPIPWEGRLEIYTRGGTRGFVRGASVSNTGTLYTEQTEALSKYRNIQGILIISQTTPRPQSFWHVVSSWDRFLPGFKGRKELRVPAEEGGTQHHGQWSLWSTDPGLATWLTWLLRAGGEILSKLRVFKRNSIFVPWEG